jgi:hypothetical protein
MKIESGTGNGRYAAVDSSNRLVVASVSLPRQHFVSKVDNNAYQVIGTATPANGTVNVLHLANNTSDKAYTITYIRNQIVDAAGGTALPNASNYWQMGFGLTYASGGSAVSPVNVFAGASRTPSAIAYDSNPTLSGTFDEIDRYYFKADGDVEKYSKEGSLILPPGRSLTARLVGDNTSGTVYTRFSFYVTDIDSLDATL